MQQNCLNLNFSSAFMKLFTKKTGSFALCSKEVLFVLQTTHDIHKIRIEDAWKLSNVTVVGIKSNVVVFLSERNGDKQLFEK